MGEKNNKESDKFEIKLNKSWTKYLIKENTKFEKKYTKLYDKLYKRFQIEFDSHYNLESKYNFLLELMDDIINANHDMKHNYNISESAEGSEKELRGLFSFFERKINDLFNENKIKKVENDFPEIFKDSKAYSIFLELHNIYKNSNTKLANYSFIFHNMKKDGYIITRQVTYVSFLSEKYNIHIDKVDNRQIGQNKRTTLYNVIVASKMNDSK